MNSTDIEIINNQDSTTLASWWSKLNSWEWPEELPDPESTEYTINGRRGQIMNFIAKKIGMKECLRDWNKERMNDEEFEIWWELGKL